MSAATLFAILAAGCSVPAGFSAPERARAACGTAARPGFARCFAWRAGGDAAPGRWPGYAPRELREAYRLPDAPAGGAPVVAVIDAFDDPAAEGDLAVYRRRFGLPPCGRANGCFRKVDQRGNTGTYPAPDAGWAAEISVDLDAVSAICPGCRIVLVEADTNRLADLGAAVDVAVRLGASVVSNSYGGDEYAARDPHYEHLGRALIVASSGDAGYRAQQPASFANVVAVGGTRLVRDGSARGWNERAWNDAWGATGSGCSALVPKPRWQHDGGCPMRVEADVAAVADPQTGIAVFDSIPLEGASGWQRYGGTSVAAPIVAAAYALAGNALARSRGGAASLYGPAAAGGLNDVLTGSNGNCPRRLRYACTARAGYDGPTGLGTPSGLRAL